MSKKPTLVLAVLLILLGVTSGIDKEITGMEYLLLWIDAMAFLFMEYKAQSLLKRTRRYARAIANLAEELLQKNIAVECLNRSLKNRLHTITSENGMLGAAGEINCMPKIVSATGQTYVDFDEVMRILEGSDFVER